MKHSSSSISKLLASVGRHKIFMLAVIFAFVAGSFAAIMTSPKIYRSESSFLVFSEEKKYEKVSDFPMLAEDDLAKIESVLFSRRLAEKVMLEIGTDRFFPKRKKKRLSPEKQQALQSAVVNILVNSAGIAINKNVLRLNISLNDPQLAYEVCRSYSSGLSGELNRMSLKAKYSILDGPRQVEPGYSLFIIFNMICSLILGISLSVLAVAFMGDGLDNKA